jgi:hypothetical protein
MIWSPFHLSLLHYNTLYICAGSSTKNYRLNISSTSAYPGGRHVAACDSSCLHTFNWHKEGRPLFVYAHYPTCLTETTSSEVEVSSSHHHHNRLHRADPSLNLPATTVVLHPLRTTKSLKDTAVEACAAHQHLAQAV